MGLGACAPRFHSSPSIPAPAPVRFVVVDAADVYRTGAGITGLPRVVARVTGEKALTFLDDTTSQDLSHLASGQGALTCLLDDKGRILAEIRALPLHDGSVLLEGEVAAGPALFGWLARVAPLSACEVIDESDRWTVTAVRGARAADVLSSLGPLPSDEHAFAETDGFIVVRVEWGPEGFDVLGSSPPDVVADSISPEWFEGARIDAGRPRFGVDFDTTTHVTETPLIERAVAEKGCYPGQESVARVLNLGHARKKIVVLDLDAASAPGATVQSEGADVGTVTSVGIYGGEAVAMATVRAELEAGSAIEAGGVTGRVRARPSVS